MTDTERLDATVSALFSELVSHSHIDGGEDGRSCSCAVGTAADRVRESQEVGNMLAAMALSIMLGSDPILQFNLIFVLGYIVGERMAEAVRLEEMAAR